MKYVTLAEVAVIALVGLLSVSSLANAEPSSRACWSMADSVKTALEAKPNAGDTAWKHYRAGTEACTKGFNSFGISQLKAAMKALGG